MLHNISAYFQAFETWILGQFLFGDKVPVYK